MNQFMSTNNLIINNKIKFIEGITFQRGLYRKFWKKHRQKS